MFDVRPLTLSFLILSFVGICLIYGYLLVFGEFIVRGVWRNPIEMVRRLLSFNCFGFFENYDDDCYYDVTGWSHK
jgi:hypothetical protein